MYLCCIAEGSRLKKLTIGEHTRVIKYCRQVEYIKINVYYSKPLTLLITIGMSYQLNCDFNCNYSLCAKFVIEIYLIQAGITYQYMI